MAKRIEAIDVVPFGAFNEYTMGLKKIIEMNYIKIGNASFNVEACAQMSREEFVSAHKRGANYDVNEAYHMIQIVNAKPELITDLNKLREVAIQALTLSEYGNSNEPGKESFEAKGESTDADDTKKSRSKGKDYSAKHAGSAIPKGD